MNVADLTPDMHEFLHGTRLGHLAHESTTWPNVVPVWYHWTGDVIEFFTRPTRPKVAHLRSHPEVSMVVSAEADEAPRWLAVEGRAVLSSDAVELVHLLCDRYCDLETAAGRGLHDEITRMAGSIVKVTIVPEQIRTFW